MIRATIHDSSFLLGKLKIPRETNFPNYDPKNILNCENKIFVSVMYTFEYLNSKNGQFFSFLDILSIL